MAKYSDIDLNFSRNPITNDVSIIEDDSSIKAAVRNIILTNLGERPFNPFLGSSVRGLLFEQATPVTAGLLQERIITALNNFEPRINILEVQVQSSLDGGSFLVKIFFRMIGEGRTQIVPITLKRLR